MNLRRQELDFSRRFARRLSSGDRSEANMLTLAGKAWVTGSIKQELVRI